MATGAKSKPIASALELVCEHTARGAAPAAACAATPRRRRALVAYAAPCMFERLPSARDPAASTLTGRKLAKPPCRSALLHSHRCAAEPLGISDALVCVERRVIAFTRCRGQPTAGRHASETMDGESGSAAPRHGCVLKPLASSEGAGGWRGCVGRAARTAVPRPGQRDAPVSRFDVRNAGAT